MEKVLFIAFSAVLFIILSPGVFLTFPKRGSLLIKTACHAVIFAGILFIVNMVISKKSHVENFQEGACSISQAFTDPLGCLFGAVATLTGDLLKPFLQPFFNKLNSKLNDVNSMLASELRLVSHLMQKFNGKLSQLHLCTFKTPILYNLILLII
jgi:hypothetical protein